MGVLTETMMRLRGEIGAWRHERVVLQRDLARQTEERRTRTSALRAVFARDRAGAHRAWFGPTLSERRAAERQQQQLAAKAQREQQQQRLAEEAKAKAQREYEQQRLAEEAKAKAQREHEHQQRLAEEAKAKAQREQTLSATAKSQPQGHNPAKPVPAPAARPPITPLAQTQRPPLKGSKKHY
jgi:hypothetical protein